MSFGGSEASFGLAGGVSLSAESSEELCDGGAGDGFKPATDAESGKRL